MLLLLPVSSLSARKTRVVNSGTSASRIARSVAKALRRSSCPKAATIEPSRPASRGAMAGTRSNSAETRSCGLMPYCWSSISITAAAVFSRVFLGQSPAMGSSSSCNNTSRPLRSLKSISTCGDRSGMTSTGSPAFSPTEMRSVRPSLRSTRPIMASGMLVH